MGRFFAKSDIWFRIVDLNYHLIAWGKAHIVFSQVTVIYQELPSSQHDQMEASL